MTEYEYKVVPFYAGCLGTLDESKLARTLNQEATNGWTFSRSIQEQRRVFIFFTREEHFLIFEREKPTEPSGSSFGSE